MRNSPRRHLLGLLFAASVFGYSQFALAKDLVIRGTVSGQDGAPAHMIRVTAYGDGGELAYKFSESDGTYALIISEDRLVPVDHNAVTLRFDTWPTLNNAREWHPSVSVKVKLMEDTILDKQLLRVGFGDDMMFIDALAGYAFAAVWEEREPDKAYADSAAARMAMMKLPPVLQPVQDQLQRHFAERAR